MRLKKRQREALVKWVAEGLQSDEINDLAADFDPPFAVTRANVAYYRKTRKADIDAIIAQDQFEALNTGLALKEERVKKLRALALRLERDLFAGSDNVDYIWTDQIKGVGSGDIAEIVEYEEFNRAEIDTYRGLLDDIAKEVGGRIQRQEITGKDGGIINVVIGSDND